VRELFERLALQKQKKRHRSDVYKRITPDYYGWREEEDGVLLELEEKASQAFKEEKAKKRRLTGEPEKEDSDDGFEEAVIEPPSQELIQEALLERKKKELLARFASY
jgi:pre-mRNA-splicing factor ISY1